MSNTIDMSELDVDMNSVEELKGFELPPEGSYTCTLSLAPKAINGETRLEWLNIALSRRKVRVRVPLEPLNGLIT